MMKRERAGRHGIYLHLGLRILAAHRMSWWSPCQIFYLSWNAQRWTKDKPGLMPHAHLPSSHVVLMSNRERHNYPIDTIWILSRDFWGSDKAPNTSWVTG